MRRTKSRWPRLNFEPLEDRTTPAWVVSLSGSVATFASDGSADSVILTLGTGDKLSHNLPLGVNLTSNFDLDSAAAGEQSKITTGMTLNVAGNGGSDTLELQDIYCAGNLSVETLVWRAFSQPNADLTLTLSAITVNDVAAPCMMGVSGVSAASLFGGSGANVFDVSAVNYPVFIESFAGNDKLTGGSQNDTFYAGDNDDQLFGNDGDDNLYGGTGNDTINGGNGNDRIFGEEGLDVVDGGSGTDDRLRLDGVATLLVTDTTVTVNGSAGGNGFESIDAYGTNGVDSMNCSAWTLGTLFAVGNGGNDTISGGALNDTIFGEDGDDTLSGNGGNDQLYGGLHTDILNGGDGDDLCRTQGGQDVCDGAAGKDVIQVGFGTGNGVASFLIVDGSVRVEGGLAGKNNFESAEVYGSDGNDVFDASGYTLGTVFFDGGGGDDTLTGTPNDDILDGDIGSDTLIGLAGNDLLYGGYELDSIYTGPKTDTINGGPGKDRIECFGGPDLIDGGADADYFIGHDLNTVVATATTLQILGGTVTNHNVEGLELYGTVNGDTITCTGYLGATYIVGGNGNDTLSGGEANDLIYGELGTDTINGNGGNDNCDGGSGDDTLNGNDGDDAVIADGADLAMGGPGFDLLSAYNTISIVASASSLQINGGAATVQSFEAMNLFGTAGGDTFNCTGFPGGLYVDAGAGADTIFGSEANDLIYGSDGNDSITGNGGNDNLFGGNDDDTLIDGPQSNALHGDAGTDTALFIGTAAPDALLVDDGNVTVSGGFSIYDGVEILTLDAGAGIDEGAQIPPTHPLPYTVLNLEPTVDAGSDETSVTTPFVRNGSFKDIGSGQTWAGEVNYGDGSGWQPLTLNPNKTFTLNHTYLVGGALTVQTKITDNQGNIGLDTFVLTRPPEVSVTAGIGTVSSRSMVTRVTVQFARLVTLNAGYFTFQAFAPGLLPTVTPVVDTFSGGTRVIFTFSGVNTDPAGSLKDGRYRLTLNTASILVGGQPLDGDNNGTPGGNFVFDFHRLFGDGDGNATVDGPTDFAQFGGVFGTTLVDSQFDYDANGTVDGPNDFAAFGGRFGGTI